jgi:hypothetical protein
MNFKDLVKTSQPWAVGEHCKNLNHVATCVRKYWALNGCSPKVIILGEEYALKIKQEIAYRERIKDINEIMIIELYNLPVRICSFPKVELELELA